MRVLFVSNLFPDSTRPTFGIHNAVLVRQLAGRCSVRVVSPRPSTGAFFRQPGQETGAACAEDEGLGVRYPSVPYVPKVGSAVNHLLYARWARPAVASAFREFCPDVILVAWAYPDGCATVRLAEHLRVPCIVVAQGTDVHEYLGNRIRRTIITDHLSRAAAVITRSDSLREQLVAAGIAPDRVRTIYNGVDATLFQPVSHDRRAERRAALGIAAGERIVLFVGNLVPVKDPLLTYEAFKCLRGTEPDVSMRLIVVGDGPLKHALVSAIARDGTGESVSLVGRCSQDRVARYMQIADALCVSSRNEGAPNVVREALACGVPVAAPRVGGVPELITSCADGELAAARTAECLASALSRVLSAGARAHVSGAAAPAVHFSWEETVRQYVTLFEELCAGCSNATA